MNKVVLKEFKKEHLSIKIIFYCLFTLVGFGLLNFSNLEIANPIGYIPAIFYCFAFLSLFTYFLNRIKGCYELLYFGLINVITGTFVLVNIYYPDSGFILSDAILLYSILNVINGAISCSKLFKEKKIIFFMKTAITLLLLFLGVFVVSSLYDKVEFGALILGYYFVIFGLLNLLEIFTNIIFSNKKLQKKILKYINFEDEKEIKINKTKTKKVVKDRTIKKIKRK